MAMIQLKKSGFRAVRVDGSMGLEARQKQLHIFRTDARCSVLVMSLKTGSHGLNLTCASNVILCEVRFLTEILDDFRRFVDEIWLF